MIFDPENNVVQLCAQGMELEGADPKHAAALFQQAWNEATNEYEKAIAAHYIARHQDSIGNKLKWDQIALECAQKSDHPDIKLFYPSLYLNIAKGYHDLEDLNNAKDHYIKGLDAFDEKVEKDGYGKMIHGGLTNGLSKIVP